MNSLKELRARKEKIRKELELNKKDIEMDFMSLRWSLLFDLGMDLVSIIFNKMTSSSPSKPAKEKKEQQD